MLPPHLEFEERLFVSGYKLVAGVDEAGRGPLAGPVSAAAVILDPSDVPEGLDDSKALTAPDREALYGLIMAKAVAIGIGFASVGEIDRINIRQATFAAMRRAVGALAQRPTYLLIDGNDPPLLAAVPGRCLGQGRRAVRVHRGSLHRGQGNARPADGAIARPASRLRFRPAQGLCDLGASRGDPPARAFLLAPPHLLHLPRSARERRSG